MFDQLEELVEKFNGKSKVIIPKFALTYLYKLNSLTLKKQFIHENSIKLISDNIYSADKINKKANLKYTIKDI